MAKNIVFVDLENLQYIDDKFIKPDTKIVIFVGKRQGTTYQPLTKENLEKVSSIELIKVKEQTKDGLDFFIDFYLGKYIEQFKNNLKDINFVICSNDQGYDPLIKHLKSNNIQIEKQLYKNGTKEESAVKLKAAGKPKTKKPAAKTALPKENLPKENPQQDNDTNYQHAVETLKKMDARRKAPKTEKGLMSHLGNNIFKKLKDDKIAEAVLQKLKQEKKVIIAANNKVQYNL